MRLAYLSLLSLAAVACSSKSSGTPATGDDGGDAGSILAYTYTPQGCNYAYDIPSSRGFTDFAVDDGGPIDATMGKPERVRVGLGGGTDKGQAGYADPTTSAAFTWETAESNHAAKVKIGTSANALTDVHGGYVFTMPPSGVLMSSLSPAYFHEVHVCGLQPGTTYFYQVGGGPTGSEVWSATQTFTTPPQSGKVTIGILGDARVDVSTWQAVALRMRDAAVTLQLVSGDMVDTGQDEASFVKWIDAIWHDPNDATKFLTLGQQVIIPVSGNHENDFGYFYANFAIPGSGAYAETFASFDVGSAHVVMFDDNPTGNALSDNGTPTDEVNAQLAWLDKDLAAANADRANHPFIVYVEHRGMFSTSTHADDSDVLAVRAAVAPLLDKYGVDIVFSGHEHEYERSKPLKAGNPPIGAPVVGSGTTYVICAGAGADAYGTNQHPASYSAKSVPYGSGTSYLGNYGLLQVDAHTLTFTAYGLKASATMVSGDDMIDTVTLTH